MSNENCCQKQMPMVSVLMSVYNEPEEWMREAIDSILGQTFTDFEFIIVNDNPERKLNREVLSDYAKQDKRIVILENEENIGLTKSLNKGLKVAKGKYIARMDADDISLPERLKKQVDFMENHEKVIVCGSEVRYFGCRNHIQNDWIYENDYNIKAQLLFGSCFIHPTVIIRKSILITYHIQYDENYKQAQDYRLWEMLVNYGEFYNIKIPLLRYRLSNQQITARLGINQSEYARIIRQRIVEKWLKDNEIDVTISDAIDFNTLKSIRRNLQNAGIKANDAYYNVFIRMLYSSLESNRIKVLWYALFNGDLFYMSYRNVLRFVLYVCRLRPVFIW